MHNQIHQNLHPPPVQQNMVRKLSDHTLTEDEISVLIKGLSFVPTPTKTVKQKRNKSLRKFKTLMVTQYFLATIFMISHPLLRANSTGHTFPLTSPF